MKIGILGGTFDPIHVGHLAAARAAMDCAELDRVLFVPSATPPHRGPAEAGAIDRLEMTKLAVQGEPRFEVSDIELQRGGVSYTVDTLRELQRRSPADKLFLILGWDAAQLLGTWHEPGEVRRLTSFVVVQRPGSGPLTGMGAEYLGFGDNRGDVVCDVDTPDISASELREQISRGEAVGDCLPPPVERYIAEHGLYGHNRQVGC